MCVVKKVEYLLAHRVRAPQAIVDHMQFYLAVAPALFTTHRTPAAAGMAQRIADQVPQNLEVRTVETNRHRRRAQPT